MQSAIKSFFISTWLVLIIVFIGWSYARYKGLSTPPKTPLPHAFFTDLNDFSVIAYPKADPNDEIHALALLKEVASQNPSVIIWIDARPRRDGTLVIARDEQEAETAPTLEEALKHFPRHKLILNIRGHRPGLIPTLISLLEKEGVTERTLIQSPEDGFLSEIRKDKPLWVFGTSLAQATKLIMLSSIGLESLSPIRGDVLVIDEERATWRMTDRAFKEASRRGLRVFAGPVNTEEQARKLQKQGAKGVLVSDPQLITTLLKN